MGYIEVRLGEESRGVSREWLLSNAFALSNVCVLSEISV